MALLRTGADATRLPPRGVKASGKDLPCFDMPALADLTLTDDDGRDVALRDLWAERPVALVFLRHYG